MSNGPPLLISLTAKMEEPLSKLFKTVRNANQQDKITLKLKLHA